MQKFESAIDKANLAIRTNNAYITNTLFLATWIAEISILVIVIIQGSMCLDDVALLGTFLSTLRVSWMMSLTVVVGRVGWPFKQLL